MKRRYSLFLLPAFVLLLLLPLSCESEKALTLVNQEAAIDAFITSRYGGHVIVRNGGANRIVLSEGTGEPAAAGDTLALRLDGYVFNNGPGTQFLSETLREVIGKGALIQGLDDGLIGVCAGEECMILFSARYGYYDEAVGIVPAMSPLLFRVQVDEIVKVNE